VCNSWISEEEISDEPTCLGERIRWKKISLPFSNESPPSQYILGKLVLPTTPRSVRAWCESLPALEKTLGVFSAWSWNRLVRKDETWPRRLVWCLPMRVLTEQTAEETRKFLAAAGLGHVPVHVLMGGSDVGEWHLHPEQEAVLVGTQDMLLSRALNRGYGAARARWPMDFGLLNHDCLWVMDEVQLMDVGLATSSQLQSFRHADSSKALRPCHTWWMSATLQESWLQSVDTKDLFADLARKIGIPPNQRTGGLWEVAKPLEIQPIKDEKDIARLASERHQPGTLSLVILNTVDAAKSVFDLIRAKTKGVEVRLVHSRFRPHERKEWRESFLQRSSPLPPEGRILVATQVVEAGVDISAKMLLTDLAPWPSLVQRFGRCARYVGETGSIVVLDRQLGDKDAKKALPYDLEELRQSRKALEGIQDASPRAIEGFEEELPEANRKGLYPYKPRHLLLRQDWDDLFDTSPDLSGADLDISRFIRSGEENDCQVFWREIPQEGPPDDWKPSRDELCSVPFLKAREWLCGKDTQLVKSREAKGRKVPVAWIWDWIEGRWVSGFSGSRILPGTVLLVEAVIGGYDREKGWDREAKAPKTGSLDLRIGASPSLQEKTDDAAESEALSQSQWKTIATHGQEVASEAKRIGVAVGLPEHLLDLLEWAGLWHDVGKSHPAFQGSIGNSHGAVRPERRDLAKAPADAWNKRKMYRYGAEHRPGFRHELASMLALFGALLECDQGNPILDPRPGLTWEQDGRLIAWEQARMGSEWEWPIQRLEPNSFNLLAYLVLSHHGKVRTSLQASPLDQEYISRDGRGMPIRGIREGDRLGALTGASGHEILGPMELSLELANLGLSELTGPSWTERVQGLLEKYGPAGLAFLESILRAGDIRASRLTTPDPLLEEGKV
jgi:CRISPR-associated endonuclease/helicase Cas3